MRAHRALAAGVAIVLASSLTVLGPTSTAATPRCEDVKATIVGTAGADVLEGTKGDDVIAALGGDDEVHGRGGDDLVCGGNGSDRLFGDVGADRVYGGYDKLAEDEAGTYLVGDVLDGGPGDDVLTAVFDDRRVGSRRAPDLLTYTDAEGGVAVDLSTEPGTATGQGSDTLWFGRAVGVVGTPYADTVTGSPGRDTLHGKAGDDVLYGKEGPDVLYGEAREDETGDDVLRGGAGDDVLGSYAGRDDLAGGSDDDYLEAWSPRPAMVAGDANDDYVSRYLTGRDGEAADGGGGWDVVVSFARLLAERDPVPTYTVDLRTGTTTTTMSRPRLGTIAGFEEHRFVGGLPWRFHGGPGADRVWAISGGPLRAWGHDGRDWLHGGPHDDLLSGGDGRDTGVTGGGRDTCRSIESGC